MGKIIHVCGTMGSGKTTLIRAFLDQHPFTPVTGDKPRPVAYVCAERELWVMGPYEPDLQTSGCDANKDTSWNYAEIQRRWEKGFTVVYEGLFMMNHTRGLGLWNHTKAVRVVRLTTSLDEARAGVVARRAAQGNHDPLPARFEDGLKGNDVRAKNYEFKMRQAGCPTFKLSRSEALEKLNQIAQEAES